MGWSSDLDLAAVGRHFSLDQGSQRGEVRFTGVTGCKMEPGMANLGELELQRAHRPRQRLPKAEKRGEKYPGFSRPRLCLACASLPFANGRPCVQGPPYS